MLQLIDKRSLEIVATLRPAPGKTLAHVEFTRDGRYALASLWEMDGALIVYDAATWREVRRAFPWSSRQESITSTTRRPAPRGRVTRARPIRLSRAERIKDICVARGPCWPS